ncbi:MAG: ATP synthase subunit I [Deltaproteobacteria bacterium]|jgi:hypothetical protein|nr:ATP synthase subunit I [Deltaproteobacteria bacterium]
MAQEKTKVDLEKKVNEPENTEASASDKAESQAPLADEPEAEKPLTGKEEAAFNNLKRYSNRMRLLARIIAIILILYLFFAHGWFWALGGLLGSLVVEGNLSILHYVISKGSPNRVERPLWVTIMKFYLLFGLTLLVSCIIIIFHLAQPFGFLAGIMVFIPAFVVTLTWCGLEYLIKSKNAPKVEG